MKTVQVKRTGNTVTLSFDIRDSLTGEALHEIAKLLKKHGRQEEADRVAAAADEPPEPDPGG